MGKSETGRRPKATGRLAWRRSRACATSECVEVAPIDSGVAIRSSHEPHAVVTFSELEWAQFLSGAKAGEFDDLS